MDALALALAPSVAHILAPAPFGGLETVVTSLVRGLHAAADPVSVIPVLASGLHLSHGGIQGLEDLGVPVLPLRVSGRNYLGERKELAQLLLSLGVDVIHTHGYRADVVDGPVGSSLGIPTVTTVHGFTGGGIRNRLYEAMQRRAFRRFDAVVAVSPTLARELVATGVPRSVVQVIQNAWSESGEILERLDARHRLGLNPDGPVVGFVGRLSQEKGPDVFVRAASEVRSTAKYCVLGSGPMDSDCRELAKQFGVDARFVWAGPVPDAGRYLRALDVLVLSSWTEGTPMVLLEAMAAGIPIVATAVGGVPDVISSKEAALCNPGDWQAIGRAVDHLLAEPGTAAPRVAAARERLRRDFASAPWIDAYRDVYRSVIDAEPLAAGRSH